MMAARANSQQTMFASMLGGRNFSTHTFKLVSRPFNPQGSLTQSCMLFLFLARDHRYSQIGQV
jgi:hypothetical protein